MCLDQPKLPGTLTGTLSAKYKLSLKSRNHRVFFNQLIKNNNKFSSTSQDLSLKKNNKKKNNQELYIYFITKQSKYKNWKEKSLSIDRNPGSCPSKGAAMVYGDQVRELLMMPPTDLSSAFPRRLSFQLLGSLCRPPQLIVFTAFEVLFHEKDSNRMKRLHWQQIKKKSKIQRCVHTSHIHTENNPK